MMALIYWMSDGVGKGVGTVHNTFIRWIRANSAPALIINGGDNYDDGRPEEFDIFFDQMDRNVAGICETAGNHDWGTTSTSPATGKIPSGYEAFWSRFPPPLSRQPIDTSKKGGARYEHFIDIDGWRLVFLDTGPCRSSNPWPMGDAARTAWLRQTVGTPGRAKMVFAHHSRLSRGQHGDVKHVDELWKALFDNTGAPLVALTMGGHDHNVSIYDPRPRTDPGNGPVPFSKGIYVMVNGSGGRAHDEPFRGTTPDRFFDQRPYCLTRINLVSGREADIEILSFGGSKDPPPGIQPQVVATLKIQL